MNVVARAASAASKLSLLDNARLFALLNMSMNDALIAGFEAKYRYNHWRPITAIRAGVPGNPALAADPTWEPLMVTPPHQDYPSGHTLGVGAAVAVLQAVFHTDTFASAYMFPLPFGVLRLSSDIRNPSRVDTENPATSATVAPRRMPVRVSP